MGKRVMPMNIRERNEETELAMLSPYACKSRFSKGRENDEELCDMRTCFQRDRDRIIHSKAFRRLMHKTQVFISPEGDHYRTRLTHTLEVSQIARTIAVSLKLNEDLTEAIALGHDLGHTPFGHLGEEDLDRVVPGGFHHNEQSVRVVKYVEKDGKGLNLTYEVTDGILNHRGACLPYTLEGKTVQISDKIAYINHDIDDALRAGIISENDIPRECTDILGETPRKRIDFLIRDIVNNSMDKPDIIMTPQVKEAMYKLRKFLFDNVYNAKQLAFERKQYGSCLSRIYSYYLENYDKVPQEFKNSADITREQATADYTAGMTDRFALKLYSELGLEEK
jgi:dGTPase